MSTIESHVYGFDEPPPRPTTPPVRRGFLVVLFALSILAMLVYGVPYLAYEYGYAWEAGRSRAAVQTLAKLEKEGVVGRSSELFRLATTAVSPAVVKVETARATTAPGNPAIVKFDRAGLGSGVVIDSENGYIVTNYHVVKGADAIVARLGQGISLAARLVGSDPKTDLAVLQVKGPLKAAAEWGDSDKLDIGDWVLAIGSPFALDRTVTAGIISATGRNNLPLPNNPGEEAYQDFLQTDAAINPGNSGGPLINLAGKVVGINTAIYSETGGYEGIGLAIPSSMAKRIVADLIKQGKVRRGYLGVRIQPVDAALAKEFKLPEAMGAVVTDVQPDGPAAVAGLRTGDVIVELDGKRIENPSALRSLAARLDVGAATELAYYRDGKRIQAAIKIGELPEVPATAVTSYGFTVRDLPSDAASPAGIGVLIDKVYSDSPAFRAGLRPGMLIVGVGRTPVRNKAEYEVAVAAVDPEQGLPLAIMTPDGRQVFVTIGGPGNLGR